MVATREVDIYREDAKTQHTLLTPQQREDFIKPYLTPPRMVHATTQKRFSRSLGAFFSNKIYLLVFAIIHLVFAVYIRIRLTYHVIFDRVLAILYYHHRAPELIKQDVKGLSRLPEHLSVILELRGEDRGRAGLESLMDEVAEISAWCTCAAIPMLSIYEKSGILKNYIPHLHRAISYKMRSYFGRENPSVQIGAPSFLSVLLLSADDGRSTLVDLTKTLTEMSQRKKLSPNDITQDLVDAEITESVMNEPDLLVLFGPYVQLQGFPPWHIRLTEIYHVEDNNGVGYQVFLRALHNNTPFTPSSTFPQAALVSTSQSDEQAPESATTPVQQAVSTTSPLPEITPWPEPSVTPTSQEVAIIWTISEDSMNSEAVSPLSQGHPLLPTITAVPTRSLSIVSITITTTTHTRNPTITITMAAASSGTVSSKPRTRSSGRYVRQGKILAGVFGGLGGIALAAFCIWVFLRKTKDKTARLRAGQTDDDPSMAGKDANRAGEYFSKDDGMYLVSNPGETSGPAIHIYGPSIPATPVGGESRNAKHVAFTAPPSTLTSSCLASSSNSYPSIGTVLKVTNPDPPEPEPASAGLADGGAASTVAEIPSSPQREPVNPSDNASPPIGDGGTRTPAGTINSAKRPVSPEDAPVDGANQGSLMTAPSTETSATAEIDGSAADPLQPLHGQNSDGINSSTDSPALMPANVTDSSARGSRGEDINEVGYLSVAGTIIVVGLVRPENEYLVLFPVGFRRGNG
ncbi:MAG: hypothetical protein Q9163_004449 [Psora crenata]